MDITRHSAFYKLRQSEWHVLDVSNVARALELMWKARKLHWSDCHMQQGWCAASSDKPSFPSTQSLRAVQSFLELLLREAGCALGDWEMGGSSADRGWSLLQLHCPLQALLPGLCHAPCTVLWAPLAPDSPFWSDFSLEAGMLSGKRGRCPSLSEWHCCMCIPGMARLPLWSL